MIDIISTVETTIREIGVPTPVAAKLAGLTDASLRRYLNRTASCPREDALRLDTRIKALRQLVKSISPIPVDLRRADLVEDILDRYENGDCEILFLDREAMEFIPRIVKFGPAHNRLFFHSADSQGKVAGVALESEALSMTLTVAEQVARKLEDAEIIRVNRPIKCYRFDKAWPDLSDLPIEEFAEGVNL